MSEFISKIPKARKIGSDERRLDRDVTMQSSIANEWFQLMAAAVNRLFVSFQAYSEWSYCVFKNKCNNLLLLHFFRHPSNEQIGVQVEAVSSTRTLALDVRLVVHTEHGETPIAGHHQLMPAALSDFNVADHDARARTCVESDKDAAC